MDSMLSSQSMEVSGAAVNVLALRLQESSQTTQFSIDQIPQSSQQVMWQLPSTTANFLKVILVLSLRSAEVQVSKCQAIPRAGNSVDIWDLKYMFLPLEQIGMNAMLVYLMVAEGIIVGFTGGCYTSIQQPRVPSSGLMPGSDVLIRAKEILWCGQESIIADVGAPEEWDKKAGIKTVDGF
ncbi:hypothetical protein LWI29_037152 [Acer saccharum]|uniref:Uncharacterized protein n=1 Tax=Acer saccharum TaxID=4024 RepID=A0AA39T938_ACESA|nr:hypothetical protein LWI29_037152 [Acer saccharum]